VQFHNRSQYDPSLPSPYEAWVSLPDGSRASGDAFTAGLYLVEPNSSLTLLATAPFRTGIAAGLIFPTYVEVPGHFPLSSATFRARVWETIAGSYQNAIANGLLHGEFQTRFPNNDIPVDDLGGPIGPIGTPWTDSMRPLTLVPEPSAIALFLAATLMLLIGRTGKSPLRPHTFSAPIIPAACRGK